MTNSSETFTIATELTQQKSLQELRKTLISGVSQAASSDSVTIFEAKIDSSNDCKECPYFRNTSVENGTFENVERRVVMRDALQSEELAVDNNGYNGLHRYAFPMITDGLVTEILSIDSADISDDKIEQIKFFVAIYRNYMLILNKYERDALTGLLNRRSFDDRLTSCIMYREVESYTYLAMLDIDHFKLVNDNFGHLYGDDVLIIFANQMRKIFSQERSLYRFGGEEFVVLLNGNKAEVESLLDKFRKSIEEYAFPQVGKVTVSIGAAKVELKSAASELVDRADKALYYAKEHGRNKVFCYEELLSSGEIDDTKKNYDSEIDIF
ncbi:MAG: GGDEF domain-containing protein [Thiotrichales bacterium]|jgi:diguanylate cyclase (GGDEF)-like protein|nr:GGDEF domain-containing protein [Thiotrichales bacterium]MBT3612696.1 GGDEF domain-containing protein [Thiotrichales bacterium]MBT4260863.1 GGDEF domain-containing protein [Thiotrichales bacterium]MBT5290521.1 GGDEF domain-containing protein [Thiotrichales bacterium]MBT5417833.1 GGDEF domain-containing protein [Thiotrichales bacterium]